MSSVVGVDIGFQNSVIAAAGRGGVDVVLNGNSNRLNPYVCYLGNYYCQPFSHIIFLYSSIVGFDDSRKIGEYATSGLTSNFKNTAKALKRLVGLAFDDPRAAREMKDLPLQFVPIPHASGPPTIGVQVRLADQSTTLSMEAILGMMIYHMGEIAAQKAQTADASIPLEKLMPQDWVIAIPNYFSDSQRRAVLTACEIVGITGCQRLMHESTATALAFGIFKDLRKEFTKDDPAHVMFIDMGASAYTVSIAAFEPGKLTVKSAHCDANLGGRDFDELIAQYVADDFANKFKGKLSEPPMQRAKTRIKILAAAEKAKKTLSPAGVKEARIGLEMLQDDFDYTGKLMATDYEAMCKPLLDRLAAPIQKALSEAGLTAKDLKSVEVVGGSVRIGCVKRKITEILGGVTLSTTMNADEAVARGAALQSAILSPRFKVLPYDIVESQPYPVTLSWKDGSAAGVEVDESGADQPTDAVTMFDRGLSFPIVRRVTLRRAGDFQVKAHYKDSATEYGLPVASDIADFTIKMTATEERKVRVNVKQDIHGIIQMSSAQMIEEEEAPPAEEETKEGGEEAKAEDKKKKVTKRTNLETTVARPLSWTPEEVKAANEAEVAMANQDRIVRETADARNELESYIYDMRDKITSSSQLGPFGTDAEKTAFTTKNQDTENWLYEDGFDAKKSVYVDKLAELRALGGPIEKRQTESEGRPAAVSTLQASIDLYRNWIAESQSNEAYSHITDEDRGKVRELVETTSNWVYEMLDKQGDLSMDQDAVLTIAELTTKNKELNRDCGPIMRKPKPKPKKEEPKPEAKKEEEKSAEAPSEDKMDVDSPEKEAPAAPSDEPMETE